MKRIPAMLLGASSLLLLLAAASCTDTLVGRPDTDDRTITFQTPQADTRAAVTDSDDMSDFQVWGWYGGDGSAATTNVFNGTIVYKDAGWNYTDGVRYWKAGQIYNFYAVYPSSGTNSGYESASYDENGNLTITNFDCTKGVDLMTASREGCVADDMVAKGTPVEFTFQHLLARVNIVGHSEGGKANITSASLTNVAIEGDYKGQQWQISESNDEYPIVSNFELPPVPTDISGDLLLLPQNVSGIKLCIEYQYPGIVDSDGNPISKEITYSLPVSIQDWEVGMSYKYSFTLIGDYIIFDVPQVNEWNEASGGIIIVD